LTKSQTQLLAGQEQQLASDQNLHQCLDTEFKAIGESQRQGTATLSNDVGAELRAISREVVKSRRMTLDIPQLGRSILTFSETDPRLNLELAPGAQPHDGMKGRLHIPDAGDVRCLEIVDENSTAGVQLPRLINIYSRISQRTAASTFWGVLEHSGKRYAVMESLDGATRLEDALSSGGFAELDLVGRLRFAWEICNAVAYFHSVNILLKSLSSQNVYVRPAKGGSRHIRPILTDLESARLVRNSFVLPISNRCRSPRARLSKNSTFGLKPLTFSWKDRRFIRLTPTFGGIFLYLTIDCDQLR
jgi:serine/threonine protein kinase